MVGNKNKKIFIITALLICIITISPYIYMFLQSFAAWDQVDKVLIPRDYTLDSYKFLLTGGGTGGDVPWIKSLFNSFFVSFSTAIIAIFIAFLVGYSISKIKFNGSKILNNVVVFQMFFPSIILLVPLFMVCRFLGIDNTYAGMILPKALNAWAIFMYITYIATIPDELIEAAKIDGASEWQIIRKVVFPFTKSITVILFLFLFMERWNELMWDTIIVSDQSFKTLNVLLSSMSGPYGSYPGALYAASVILTVPIIVLFIAFGKKVNEGMKYVSK